MLLRAFGAKVGQAVRIRRTVDIEMPWNLRIGDESSVGDHAILYSLGKLMVLKLREDYKAARGDRFSLRGFHDALLGNGTVPLWLHRDLMLGANNGSMIE